MKRLVEIEPFDLSLLHYDSTAKVWKEIDSKSAVQFTNKSFKIGNKIYVDLYVFVKGGSSVAPANFFPSYKIGKNVEGNFIDIPSNRESYNMRCEAWNSVTATVIPTTFTTTACFSNYLVYVNDATKGKPGYVTLYINFNPSSAYSANFNFYRFTGWLPADILEEGTVYKYDTSISESMGGNWTNNSQEISANQVSERYSNTNLYKIATGTWIGDYVLGEDEDPADFGVNISKTFADGTQANVDGTYDTTLKRFKLVIPDNFYNADATHGEVVGISFSTF